MIENFAEKHKLPGFRIKQFDKAFYQEAINSFDELTTWPKDLREKLNDEGPFSSLDPINQLKSNDGKTTKILFRRKVDKKCIESVLMRFKDGRNSVCVSCMVGCPVGCKFCATGKMGFGGNLSADEIVDQVLYFQRLLKSKGNRVNGNKTLDAHLSNIVFMGMGEPMLNLKEVQKALAILTDPSKVALSERRITISTSGYVPQLKRLIASGFRGQIAVSLHAPNQKLREKLMPVAKQHSLDELLAVLDDYVEKTNKKVSYEYILISGVNDSDVNAQELIKLFKNRLAHINLIPYNPIPGVDFKRTDKSRVVEFAEILKQGGINTTIRITMGDDIKAACGQLASNNH
ncbi:MAG: putative dual-specificity RNA methyltransferase RlmN [candidate division WS6 bacterium GW2011_GWA2_37_6]|uniref:Probable dual-specificity RNA methyltransferase RlmN n=1 Tax=candidate division WS6 bacterium GW2011_GWA2_37_6 TaxID=1619087 RepID=A0A0G0GVZ8_9BACT|nr:MAG: putative dual-specificity RNA methyltransferase RlmN [candidate division WS6 bacterium GW2011_GWA2_37_6]